MSVVSYVLITAARNEANYITKTIESVINQTILPKKWMIVSDGSTDKTDEIVARYARKYDFIQLVRSAGHKQRDCGLKVNAFNSGYRELKGVEYDFLGNLDADVSFGSHYYEYLFEKFQQKPKLAIAGGIIFDLINGKWVKWVAHLNCVGGPIQLFRSKFFKEMGGYTMIPGGGEDAIAEYTARRYGWEVRSFPEIKVFHHRRMGTEGRGIRRARFFQGVRDYLIGFHPLFEIAKCLRRVVERPYFIGSLFWLSGYFWAELQMYKREISPELVRYIRRWQMHLLVKPYSIFKKNNDKKF